MGWKSYIPFFDYVGRLRYKKASTASTNNNSTPSPNANPAYVYCREGVNRSASYTCYLTVNDAVTGNGPSQLYQQLPPNAIVVPTVKS